MGISYIPAVHLELDYTSSTQGGDSHLQMAVIQKNGLKLRSFLSYCYVYRLYSETAPRT